MKRRADWKIIFPFILLLPLVGCSLNAQESVSLGVAVAFEYVSEESFSAFSDDLIAAFPQLNTEEAVMSVRSVSTGNPDGDPMGAMAGMTQITAMLTSGEIELLICDPENARRYGDNGETYMTVSEAFTEEEMRELGIVGVTMAIVDDETGEETGEETEEVGVDLSGSAKLCQLFSVENPAAYIVSGTQHADEAKEVIKYLLTLE